MIEKMGDTTIIRNGTRATAMVGFIVLAMVAFFAYTAVLAPRFAEAGEIAQAAADQESLNDAAQQQVNDLTAQLSTIEATIAQARDYAEKMPADSALSETLREIVAAASASGISESQLNAVTAASPMLSSGDGSATLPGQGGVTVATMQTVITVDADEARTVRFLKNLTSMKRAYLLASVVSTQSDQTKRYTTTITGNMYVLQQADLGELVKQIEQLKGSLGIPTAPTPTPAPVVTPGA